MSRIAVLGASGFVGRHLVPLLLAQQNDVRGLARTAVDGTGSSGTLTGFDFRPGDIRNRRVVEEVVDGCEFVVHLAAPFNHPETGEGTTVDGTRNVIAACARSGVKRLVFLSCLGAQASSHSPFYAEKWRAEQLIRASEVPYTILLPSLVVGNGDGLTRPLAALLRGLPVVPIPDTADARLQPIDVGDLCRAIVVSLTSERVANEMVSVGGPMFLTLGQIVDLIASHVGVQRRKLLVPDGLQPAAARAVPSEARALFLPARVAQLRQGVVASPGIVPRMLEFNPSDIRLGLPTYLA